jgi:hypothetical protein
MIYLKERLRASSVTLSNLNLYPGDPAPLLVGSIISSRGDAAAA